MYINGMVSFTLHPAVQPADYTEAYHLYRACWKPAVEARGDVWEEAERYDLHYTIFRLNGVDVIHVDDKPAGILGVKEKPDELYLYDLCLLPEYRNQHIGSSILTMLKEQATTLSKPLTLQTKKQNKDAQRFYTREDFTIVDDNAETDYIKMRWLPAGQT